MSTIRITSMDQQLKECIEGLKEHYDKSIIQARASVKQKKEAILNKYNSMKFDIHAHTQHIPNVVDIIISADPIKKFHEITDGLSESLKEALRETFARIYERTIKAQIQKNHEKTVSDIFFHRKEIENNFERVLGKYHDNTMSYEDYLSVIYSTQNKIVNQEEWERIIKTGILKESFFNTPDTGIKQRVDIFYPLSYHSPQTTLKFGINTGLFLQNLVTFFPHKAQEIIRAFSNNPSLVGGLAFTEQKGSGSDLIKNLKTTHRRDENGNFHIKGVKHYQGLSHEGTDYWILLSKEEGGRSIDLFIVDTKKPGQKVVREEKYEMNCLELIYYGVNTFNIILPPDAIWQNPIAGDRLGFRALQSIFTNSRLQFPMMLQGHLQFLFDRVKEKCSLRKIEGKAMIENGHISSLVGNIETYKKILRYMNQYLIKKKISLRNYNTDLLWLGNIFKTLGTEYANKAGAIALKLQGGDEFQRKNPIYSRVQDVKPFATFEGPNDMLYAQTKVILPSEKTRDLFKKYNVSLDGIESLMNVGKGEIYSKIGLINIFSEIDLQDENCYKILLHDIQNVFLNNKWGVA